MAAGYTASGFKPLRKRAHHVFLSHAHVDSEAVERLRRWLGQTAGLEVWFDQEKVKGGQTFPSALSEGVADSRSMIVAVSRNSLDRNWVKSERDLGLAHQGEFPQFSVVPVRLEPCDLPHALFAHSAVDAFGGTMSGPDAAKLLRSIHGLPDLSPPAEIKTQVIQYVSTMAGDPPNGVTSVSVPIVYVACGWRDTPNEIMLRNSVCEALGQEGMHLIGDAEDHPNTVEARIKSILSGCSAQAIILPKRAGAEHLEHPEYKALCAEIRWGQEIGLRQFVLAEGGLQLPAEIAASAMVVQVPDAGADHSAFKSALRYWAEELGGQCESPKSPDYVIVATDYEDLVIKEHVIRHIEQVTGLPCLKGNDFGRQIPSRKIELAIRNASLVIANVVSATQSGGLPEVNLNTCIEAGIAMGAKRQMHIIARRGEKDTWKINQSLPFMIRDNTVETYFDDQHLLGLVHRFSRPFRRRIIN